MELQEEFVKNKVSTIYKIKDSAIFLGALYCLSLLVMLPVYLRFNNLPAIAGIIFISLLAILLVHFAMNWLYYFVISTPVIASATLFVLGWALTIFSPLLEMYIRLIIDIISMTLSIFSFDSSLTFIDPLFKIIDRVAAFLIVLSGIFWWLVKKGENIQYKALAFYIVFIVFLGAILGIGNMTVIFFFLFIWYLLFVKVKGLEDIEDIGKVATLFKIGATVLVLSGISGMDLLNTGVTASMAMVGTNNIYDNFLVIYPKILGILIIFGIWKPKTILKRVPDKFKKFILVLKEKGVYLLKV